MNSILMMKMKELEQQQLIKMILYKMPSFLRKRIEDGAKEKMRRNSVHNPRLTLILLQAHFQCNQRLKLIKLLAGCLMMRRLDKNV